jgi:hypothetical protein
MTHIMSAVPAQATFGRDSAMFEGLLDFVAQLSVGLWGLVIITVVMRFVGVWMYRHGAARRARRAAMASSAAIVPAVMSTITPAKETVPAAMAATDAVPAMAERTSLHAVAGKDAVHTVMSEAATFDHGRQPDEAPAPAAAASSTKEHRRTFRRWRGEHRSAANVPALAANSTEP